MSNLCNAVISGIVSITACCNNIELWAAAVIGFFACIIYHQTKRLLKRYEIDDPLDITQVHGICGFFAIVACGIFDIDRGFLRTGNASFLIVQLIGAACLALWSGTMSFLFFFVLKTVGRLRIFGLFEVLGVDFMVHGTQNQISMETFHKEKEKQLE